MSDARDDGMPHPAGFTTPMEAFRAAVDAIYAKQWRRAASLCDPVSVRAFKRQLIERVESYARVSVPTIESYMRQSPDMPRIVAEYQVAQMTTNRTREDFQPWWRGELPGIESEADLAALDAPDVFACWLDGTSDRSRLDRAVQAQQMTSQDAARTLARLNARKLVVIGAIVDAGSIAHVLYREASDDESGAWLDDLPVDERRLRIDLWGRQQPSIATCRRQDDGSWLLVADTDLGTTGLAIAVSHEEDH